MSLRFPSPPPPPPFFFYSSLILVFPFIFLINFFPHSLLPCPLPPPPFSFNMHFISFDIFLTFTYLRLFKNHLVGNIMLINTLRFDYTDPFSFTKSEIYQFLLPYIIQNNVQINNFSPPRINLQLQKIPSYTAAPRPTYVPISLIFHSFIYPRSIMSRYLPNIYASGEFFMYHLLHYLAGHSHCHSVFA